MSLWRLPGRPRWAGGRGTTCAGSWSSSGIPCHPQSYSHHHPDLRQDIRLLRIRFYSYRHLLGQVMKEYRQAFTPLSKQKHQLSMRAFVIYKESNCDKMRESKLQQCCKPSETETKRSNSMELHLASIRTGLSFFWELWSSGKGKGKGST